jgi:prepilin-type N-terminal cleavage/methylation domain-containing protein
LHIYTIPAQKMKLSGFATRSLSGFTLIELLVSMVVLAIVMGIVLQVVNGILKTTQLHSQQMDSIGAARRAMDILSLDLSKAVVGESSAILVAPGSLAMLTDRRGTNSSDHRFLGVTYNVNSSNQIVRTYKSFSNNETDLISGAQDTNNSANSILADGILGWSIRAMTLAGPQSFTNPTTPHYATNNYNGFPVPPGWQAVITTSPAFASSLTNRAQGLDVWIVAVDEQTRSLLDETSKLDAVRQALEGDPSSWRLQIDESNEIPISAKASIQILHKTISLP